MNILFNINSIYSYKYIINICIIFFLFPAGKKKKKKKKFNLIKKKNGVKKI